MGVREEQFFTKSPVEAAFLGAFLLGGMAVVYFGLFPEVMEIAFEKNYIFTVADTIRILYLGFFGSLIGGLVGYFFRKEAEN